MFQAAYLSSSGAPNCIAASCLYTHVVTSRCPGWVAVPTQPGQWPVTTWVYKPEAANTVWSSWWWVLCRSKHVEPSTNFGIINSITRLHLVSCFYWFMKYYYLGDIFLNNFVRGSTAPLGVDRPIAEVYISYVYTHVVGLRTCDQFVAEAANHTTHNKHNRRTSMSSAGLKPPY
jgi:hypothetical protein